MRVHLHPISKAKRVLIFSQFAHIDPINGSMMQSSLHHRFDYESKKKIKIGIHTHFFPDSLSFLFMVIWTGHCCCQYLPIRNMISNFTGTFSFRKCANTTKNSTNIKKHSQLIKWIIFFSVTLICFLAIFRFTFKHISFAYAHISSPFAKR